jgi:hypothetical protein
MANNAYPEGEASAFERVLQLLNTSEVVRHQLLDALIRVLDECSRIPTKRGVIEHAGLKAIFAHRMGIVDRTSLINWFYTFSPIIIQIDDTGHLYKMSWSVGRVRRCKLLGLPVWDLEGAGKVHWASFYVEYIRRAHASTLTPEQARAQRQALKDNALVHDQQIRDYLRRNPIKEEKIGKRGVPQDKYRWGFYGHQTMEYDSWGRLGKGE